ncbi:phosphatases II, partial [Fistulina hepatica ATCC 64428]
PLLSPTLPTTRSKNTPCASRIIPSLYISGLSCAEDETWLRRNHITHILSVLPERICIPTTLNIRTKQVPIGDTPFADIESVLPGALDFIDAALCQNAVDVSPALRANVLVHCQEGRSRSVTVVAAYLMKTFNMLPDAALELIQSKRSVANPNFGFLLQLYEYARCSLGRHELQIP